MIVLKLSNQASSTPTRCIFHRTRGKKLNYEGEDVTQRGQASTKHAREKKILFSLMHPIKKQHPIVIQLVQVQLHAFQLQIRAEL